jgi:hypothetical protein
MDNQIKAAEAAKGPLKVFRIDDVSASVFAREAKKTTYYSVSFSRSYKGADGQWKYTRTFDMDDLGKLQSLIEQVRDYLHQLRNPQIAK